MNIIRKVTKSLNALALAALVLAPAAALAEKISKHKDSEGFEDWYWEGTVTVKRGQSHTFWAKDLTDNTAITDMEVYAEYSYTEEGEKYEDSVYASESCEKENSSGGFDKYVLLTADDWDWVPESKSSLKFKVRVSGWEPDDDQTTADISFKYGHSEGDGDYPGEEEDPEPVVVTPKGAQGNPVTFTIGDKNTVQDPGATEWEKPTNWDESETVDGNVYLKTSALVAGRKYVFGFEGLATNATVTMALNGGENLFTAEAASTLIADCEGSCWAVVVPTAGAYEIVVDDDSNDFTCHFGADACDPKDDEATGATKLTPSSKGVSVDRTLWADDEDWFSFAATAGTYYKFAFSAKSGSPEVRVYDAKFNECDYTLLKDPASAVMIAAAAKGTYYVKVARAEGAAKTDDPYTLAATSANPGTIKFAKAAVTVKDSAGYVDLSVTRTGSEGATRVTYTTAGDQSSAENALYYPTTGTLEWADGDKSAKTIRVKIVPQNYGQVGKFQVKIAAIDPESEEFDAENEFPAVIAAGGDTATVTVTATAKAAPGTIQLADCDTPKKPVVDVTATNGTMVLKFARIGGTDGMVSVKIETVDKTAKNGVDYGKRSAEFTWLSGDANAYDFEIPLVSSPDNTATKTFTVKLTANTGKAYAKPTLASSTITVNIANDRFATTVAAYSKALPKTSGIAIKESKSGTWFVGNDGSIYSSLTTGTLTFTLTGPGVFKYKLEGEEEDQLVVPYGEKTNNKVVIDASDKLLWYTWEPLPENLETLRQCVKYSRVFTNGIAKVASGKLPDGLKLAQDKATKKWSISGTPTKAGYFYVKLTDGKKTPVDTEEINFNVVAAGTAIGTFSGIVKTFDTVDGLRSLASVTLTAAATGKLSAKVLTGGKTYTFADTGYASFEEEGDDTVVKAELPLIQKITEKVGTMSIATTVTNWLACTIIDSLETDDDARNAEAACEIRFAKLPDSTGKAYDDDIWYEGTLCRDNSKVTDWVTEASKFAGYYTVSLVNDSANEGEPKGNGYLTLTFDAKGKVKIAGMLADGTSYSASSVSAALVERGGETAIRIPLYACKGTSVFGGWLELIPGEDGALLVSSDSKFVWANDAATATREGENGFNLEIVPVGGWYDTVTNLQKWFLEYDFSVDLPSWETDSESDFLSLLPSGYAFAANPCGQVVDVYGDTVSVVKQSLVKDSVTKLYDFASSVNASNVKFTFKRATGVLSGTFDLWYEGVNTRGVTEQKSIAGLKHSGVLLLSRGNDGYLGDDVWTSGFYLVPQTLSYTGANGKAATRKWTGSYRFDVKATNVGRNWGATPAQ